MPAGLVVRLPEQMQGPAGEAQGVTMALLLGGHFSGDEIGMGLPGRIAEGPEQVHCPPQMRVRVL